MPSPDTLDEAPAAAPAAPPDAPAPPAAAVSDLAGVIGHADQLAGAGRLHEAIQIYRNVLRWLPRLPGLHFNLGVALLRHERPQEAVAHFTTVTESPQTPDWLRLRARQALGLALEQSGQPAAAAAQYRQLLQAEPANFGVLRQLATLYRDLGLAERALAAFEQCQALWPQHCGIALEVHTLRHAVAGGGAPLAAAAQAALLQACLHPSAGVEPPPPRALLAPPFDIAPADVARLAVAHARYIQSLLGAPAPRPGARARAGRRLRLAYAAPDVHGPAGAWVRHFVRHHDRSRFEVCLYTWGGDDGSVEREQAHLEADAWFDVAGLGDAALAQRLQADAIDVLLDPGSAGPRARHGLFARRPVPLQLAWLADAVSACGGWFDALLTDAAQLGAGELPPGSSPLQPLPQARPVAPTSAAPAQASARRALGLPARAPVIGLLAAPAALDTDVLAAALRLVPTVPGAVLWLRDPGRRGREQLRQRAVAAGVHAEQLHFTPVDDDATSLPARLQACDLVLDPGRDDCATLVGAALLARVPVLALRSRHALQGAAASLLHASACPPQALADSLFAWEAQARLLLRQPRHLLAWRQALRRDPTPDDAAPARPLTSVAALEVCIDRLWEAIPAGA